MKFTTFAQSLHDLNVIKAQAGCEVLLGHRDFSRFGKLTTPEFKSFAMRARELGLRIIFEWDILMTEDVFEKVVTLLPEFFTDFDALRVQDPGALEWALHHTHHPLQFVAENGNHNLPALQAWAQHAGQRLERIVLSIELSKDIIAHYLQQLKVPCELLVLGRILLFYSPRSLLAPLQGLKLSTNTELAAIGESEESPHKGFPILENRHGTFMFHIKEFCLIEYAHELRAMGLAFLRLDLRWEDISLLSHVVSLVQEFTDEKFAAFKEAYSQDLMRGFYLVNKTDVLFPKLKNHRLQKREGNYLGEVLEAEKGCHLAILVKNPRGLSRGDKLEIIHPEGKKFLVDIFSLRNSCLQEVELIPEQQLAIIQFVGGVWAKSHVFYQS